MDSNQSKDNNPSSSIMDSDETIDTATAQAQTVNALLRSGENPWSVNVGAPINAMSANPSVNRVVLAGREVLKIISCETLAELTNLRVGKVNMNYSSNDVRWNPNESHSNLIATAATNGSVVIWNLNSKGKKFERAISDHTRAVNRIAWQPREPMNLLSGSQDGLMKLWDLRDPTKAATTYDAKSEVRDVAFNPLWNYYFAAALDNGNIQIWDTRNNSLTKQITAHQGLILSLAWHPSDPHTLASGGRDRVIKTWDLRSGVKPTSITQTIAIVGRLTWRPHSHGRPWHIASSSGSTDNAVHIWDTKHPFMPLVSLYGSKDITTGQIWTENNNMLACSKDGNLRIFDLQRHGHVHAKYTSSSVIRWSIHQDIVFGYENVSRNTNPLHLEPVPNQRPDATALINSGPGFMAPPFDLMSHSHHYHHPTNQQNLSSISFSRLGIYSTNFNSSNLSSASDPTNNTNSTDQMSIGFDTTSFKYLAENYVYHGKIVSQLCESNCKAALACGANQTAQIWKMLQLMFTPSDDLMRNTSNGSTNAGNVSSPHHFVSAHLHHYYQRNTASGGTQTPHLLASHSGIHSRDERDMKINNMPQMTIGNANGISETAEIPVTNFGGANSDVLPSPAIAGSRSVETFSPNWQDDWDFAIMNVPTSTASKQLINSSKSSNIQTDHLQHQGSGVKLSVAQHEAERALPNDETISTTISSINGTDNHENQKKFLVDTIEMDDDSLNTHGASTTLRKGIFSSPNFSAFQAASLLENQPEWDGISIVLQLLDYNEHQGDVQLNIFVCLVLGDLISNQVDPQRFLAWMIAYIDILHRLQLWNCANLMAKHSQLESVRNMNKQSTTIATKCASCSKAILGSSGIYCENCKKPTSTCAICRLPVKGALIWCPGCGHGGHSTHIKSWFSQEIHCPTGCGHICHFKK